MKVLIRFIAILCLLNCVVFNLSYAQNLEVDIIFVMDTSGSMRDESDALKTTLNQMETDLQQEFDLTVKVWAITEDGYDGSPYSSSYSPFNWITTSVQKELPGATVDWDEDWGPAVYDIATKYNGWRTNAVKIVVPISDEGPENGNGINQDDRNIISKAGQATQAASIYVLPVVGSGATQDVKDLANNLGNGFYFDTTAGTFTAEKMKEVIKKILAVSTGTIVFPPTNISHSILKNGARVYWQGAEGASYYKYRTYIDKTLTIDNITTQPYINIASPGKDCEIKIEVSACNDNADPQCTNPVEYTLNLSSNPSFEIIKNPTLSETYLKSSEVHKSDYLNKNPSKIPNLIAEPVDVSTGNFIYEHTDMFIPAPGVPFVVKRSYNSIYYKTGWYFEFFNSLNVSDTDAIKINWGDKGRGGVNTFTKVAGGNYIAQYGAEKLYIKGANYVIEKPSGLKYIFDINGKQIAIKNKQGLGIQFEYPDANTILVKDIFGNTLASITLNNDGQIEKITDPAGNFVLYSYDYNGNIESFTDRKGQITNYEYDTNGYLIKIIGPDGNTYIENTYDTKGRVIEQRDGSGHVTTFSYTFDQTNSEVIDTATVVYPNGMTINYDISLDVVKKQSIANIALEYEYDVNNKIINIKDANARQWRFERNEIGLITKTIDPAGNEYIYSYDNNNNLISIKDSMGYETKFEYDANNNLTKIIYPDGTYTNIEYNSNNLPLKVIDAAGNVTEYAYNARGLISSITLPNGGKISYTYDDIGNIVSLTDPSGNKTLFDYDKNGKLTKITNALGQEAKFEYNVYGDLVKITTPKDRTIRAEYNVDGLLSKITLPDGKNIEYTYDVLGRLIEIKDATGRVVKREYDDFGRLSKIVDPKGNTLTFIYDTVDKLTEIIDSKGNSIKIGYDELYRPYQVNDAYGNLIFNINYNALSMPTKITDAVGRTLEFNYDAFSRLVQTTLVGNISARAQYDALGRIVKLIDPKGYETIYEYDALGNLIKETNSLGNTWIYSYDVVGRLVQAQFPNGVSLTYTYDAINRLTGLIFKKNDLEKSINYVYDEAGNLLSAKDEVGEITYTYDINDEITERKDALGNVVKYEYDDVGRLTKLIYPDGNTVFYTYDDSDNLVEIKDFRGNITKFKYDDNNNLSMITYPNGYHTLYTYDNNDWLISIKNYDKDGKEITGDELTRDEAGNIISIKKTEYIKPDPNRVTSKNFTFNEYNQIVRSDEGEFRYDANGNLLNYILNGKEITFQYDLVDRLIEANIGPDVYTYKYDAEGNRIEVTKNGHTIRYVMDNFLGLSRPIAETDASNHIQKYYIWGNNGLLYTMDNNGKLYIYLYNYRGDTNAVVDETGKIVAAYTYSAYGKILGEYEEIDNPFKFLGKYGVMSDNDKLYYIRARYYAPDLGRFVQVDLINARVPLVHFMNRYTYTFGDPLNYIDENGEFLNVLVGAGVGALIGGGVEYGSQVWNNWKQGKGWNSLRDVDLKKVGAAALGGAASGALVSTGVGAAAVGALGATGTTAAIGGATITGALSGAAGSAVETVADNLLHERDIDYRLKETTLEGALFGGLTAGLFSSSSFAIRGARAGMGAMKGGQSVTKAIQTAWKREAAKQIEYELTKWKTTIASARLIRSSIKSGLYNGNPLNAAKKVIYRTELRNKEWQSVHYIINNAPQDLEQNIIQKILPTLVLNPISKRKGILE